MFLLLFLALLFALVIAGGFAVSHLLWLVLIALVVGALFLALTGRLRV